MNKKLFASVCVVVLGVIGALLMNNGATTQREDLWVVGIASGYAPFISTNGQGEYEGFDIDVANAIAQRMGKKLVLRDLGSMAPLFMALENGSIDAIMWGLSITAERLEKVAMIHYQGKPTTSYSLLFWQTIPATVKSIEDMGGMTVCVEPASCQDATLSRYPLITRKPTERVDDALLYLQYCSADAALVEPSIAAKFKRLYPEIQIMDVPLCPEDQVMGIGIAVKKRDDALQEQLQQSIAQLIEERVIASLEQRWEIV
ncbi:MAG: transporter substrate-binding domain-containing protein [Candidatus Babeliales bacterium]